MNVNNDAATTSQLQSLLEAQRKAHIKDPYPSLSLRIDRIQRMIDMLVCNEQKIIDAVMADFENRSPTMTRSSDIMPTLDNLKHVKKHLKNWMKPEKRNSKFPLGLIGGKSKVEYVPLGVVGNISPWNFPIQLALSPMADIFGAGNRVMLKPSELSPNSSQLMADMAKNNFDSAELAVVLGGPEVAAEFAALKFDHLLFTGSTNIARLVAQSAAPQLVPLTLELGGKNPVIVSQSADVKLTAEKLMWAKAMNGGQICLCPDTVFLPDNKIEEFISACKAALDKMYPDIANNEEYTHIISPRHADRLREMTQEARDAGARVVEFYDDSASGRRVLPKLIFNADASSRVAQEEIFGPLMAIQSYSSLQSVLNGINEGSRPLAIYYFGEDRNEIEKITHETVSGGMVINDLMAHILQDDLPFGGVGESGTGSYHGFDGFKNFSHAKAVYKQSKLDPFKILRPPYSDLMKKNIAKQIKP
ncbi:coniferyl aldehyde dehydrogenase [Spongiibacter sp. KMU-166]|uniref:Aldehyde dehydrogenase n=1 Tax=Spongiibacter thalassae TaxID=2721624 RepID=A0ABX1GIH4_9GAMM|nr:coniferyl aldehyde dehydrogenase [Spongiibacter thalassae]NKI18706.1 coniferyl aldehyde dehydrogenase [Spongiibacter thalassae]